VYHQRHQITINEETVSSLPNTHSAELCSIEKLSSCIKVVYHNGCIFGTSTFTTKGIKCNFSGDSFKDHLKVAENLPHIILKGLNKLFKGSFLPTSFLLVQNLA
jgi:hypothetical protein